MTEPKLLRVGVIGPTGYGGSHLCVELINRGHTVVGLSRKPEKLGKHEHYIPRPVDIDAISFSELAKHFEGIDVLVSEYGPQATSADAQLYIQYLETVRKIILAVKRSSVKYFLFVGGAGSLHVPGTQECCVDHPDFFMAYRRAIAMSEAHIAYLDERFGIGSSMRVYHDAHIAEREGRASEDDLKAIREFEDSANVDDRALDMIKAARTAYMFFDGNTSFKWSFVSPSALYKPGVKTGKYEISVDEMVLEGTQHEKDVFEGRLTGISVADMAIAIADEVANENLVGKHWSAWGDISKDRPAPAFLTLEVVEGGRN